MMYLRSKVQLDCYPSFLVTLALKKHFQLGSHFGLSSSRRFSLQSSSSLVPTLDYFHVQLQFFFQTPTSQSTFKDAKCAY
jgi:hypothetical protein